MVSMDINRKNGMVTVLNKKTQTEYRMWPVDAREALLTGQYILKAPMAARPASQQAPAAPAPPAPPAAPWLISEGQPMVIEDETSITVAELRAALHEAGESFRSDANKADLLAHWNEYASKKE